MAMPPTSTRPMELRAAAPAPVTRVRGKWPAMVAALIMRMGRSAGQSRLVHGIAFGVTLLLQPVGELNDEDAVS